MVQNNGTDNKTITHVIVALLIVHIAVNLASDSDANGQSPKGKIAMKKQIAIVTSHVPTFEELLRKMEPHFKFFARRVLRLKGDNLDDALQELSAMAYEMYCSLVKRGKDIFYSPIMKYTIGRYKEGRRFIGSNSTDALSEGTRQKGRTIVKKGDTLYTMLDMKNNVAKTVQFKIDFTDWYHLQTPKDQDYITDLALGYTQSEVARRHGVSSGAICQRQRKYANSWYNFIDPPENDSAVIAR